MSIRFIIPGDIGTPTGGYRYDRTIMSEWQKAGVKYNLVSLDGGFPFPTQSEIATFLDKTANPSHCTVTVIDGLAGGASSVLMEALSKQSHVVALVHHPLCLENGLTDTQAKQLKLEEGKGLKVASRIITTSKATAKTVTQLFEIDENIIDTILPGVERGHISKPSQDGPLKLLCVGSVIERKGHAILIEALSQLKHLDWELHCYGPTEFDPALYEQVSKAVKHSRLEERIRFHGAVSEETFEAAFLNADLFVLPSYYEGYGMAYAEAIVRGLPVIGTTGGAIPDTIPNGCGMLIKPGDVNELTQALTTMLTNQPLRLKYREATLKAAPSFPKWEASAKQFANIVQKLS